MTRTNEKISAARPGNGDHRSKPNIQVRNSPMNDTTTVSHRITSSYDTATVDGVRKLAQDARATGMTIPADVEAIIVARAEQAERQAERDAASRDEAIADLMRAQENAVATPCAFSECTGITHEAGLDVEHWVHRIMEDRFAGVRATAEVSVQHGRAEGFIVVDVEGDMTAAEIRTMADVFEDFPTWLRRTADQVDLANAAAAL